MIDKETIVTLKKSADIALEITAFLALMAAASDAVTLEGIQPLVRAYSEKANQLAFTVIDLGIDLEQALKEEK